MRKTSNQHSFIVSGIETITWPILFVFSIECEKMTEPKGNTDKTVQSCDWTRVCGGIDTSVTEERRKYDSIEISYYE